MSDPAEMDKPKPFPVVEFSTLERAYHEKEGDPSYDSDAQLDIYNENRIVGKAIMNLAAGSPEEDLVITVGVMTYKLIEAQAAVNGIHRLPEVSEGRVEEVTKWVKTHPSFQSVVDDIRGENPRIAEFIDSAAQHSDHDPRRVKAAGIYAYQLLRLEWQSAGLL